MHKARIPCRGLVKTAQNSATKQGREKQKSSGRHHLSRTARHDALPSSECLFRFDKRTLVSTKRTARFHKLATGQRETSDQTARFKEIGVSNKSRAHTSSGERIALDSASGTRAFVLVLISI